MTGGVNQEFLQRITFVKKLTLIHSLPARPSYISALTARDERDNKEPAIELLWRIFGAARSIYKMDHQPGRLLVSLKPRCRAITNSVAVKGQAQNIIEYGNVASIYKACTVTVKDRHVEI